MSDSRGGGGECQVRGHGDQIIAKRRDSLNSQSLVYDGDRQALPGSSESFQRFDRWQIQADC